MRLIAKVSGVQKVLSLAVEGQFQYATRPMGMVVAASTPVTSTEKLRGVASPRPVVRHKCGSAKGNLDQDRPPSPLVGVGAEANGAHDALVVDRDREYGQVQHVKDKQNARGDVPAVQ